MLRNAQNLIVAGLATLSLAGVTLACHRGNGPATNAPDAAPVAPPVTAAGIDFAVVKGIWIDTRDITADDLAEFRKSGKVEALCRKTPRPSVEESACVLDDKGGIFPYAAKSWSDDDTSLQLGDLSRAGRLSFREVPDWPFDKTLYAEVKFQGDSMLWIYKHDGQNGAASQNAFVRTTVKEVAKLSQALDTCGKASLADSRAGRTAGAAGNARLEHH